MKTVLALIFLASAALARAEEIARVGYPDLVPILTARVDFDSLPSRAEPGINFDHPLYFPGAWLGEMFRGQQSAAPDGLHDLPALAPGPGPLAVAAGEPQRNLSVAFHRGFGSNALFPLGPTGFPAITSRGEGSVAILFDHDQSAVGFRIHAEYPAPLGSAIAPPGKVEIAFFARDGALIARMTETAGAGVSEFGYRRANGQPDIAGVSISNTDPGGIAIDDIIFARPIPLG